MNDKTQTPRPIIIKRVKKAGHDFHGGSWKVAFADFATAMMAFFLLLWLMGSTNEEQKEAISGYFHDPTGIGSSAGASKLIIGEGGADSAVIEINAPSVEVEVPADELDEESLADLAERQELENLEKLKKKLEEMVFSSAAFKEFKEQVYIDITES